LRPMAERNDGKHGRPEDRRFSRRIFLAGGAAVTGSVIWGEASGSAPEWEHRPPPKIPGGTGNTGNTGSSGPPRPPSVLEFGIIYLPRGVSGVRYLGFIWVVNGRPPLTWAVTAGALPPGLVLNPSDGLISGTAGAPGSYTFTVTVTDSASQSISRAFTIHIG
jgi:hypothetical protein